MNKLIGFGESVAGYDVAVLDEREVRAAAGILFLFALVSFMNSWLLGNFRLTQIFVEAFLIDFGIRIFVNPAFAPSMILGRYAVRHQAPEWAGAPQKRFAWSIGFALAAAMFWLIVVNDVIGPVNLFVCAACLTLMFFESAFGICLACKVYNAFTHQEARHCPGGVCEVGDNQHGRRIGLGHAAIVFMFLGVLAVVADRYFPAKADSPAKVGPALTANPECVPPDWAVAMGHAEMWKLHHNCK